MGYPSEQKHICMTFKQCWTNVEDVGTTLYKCYTNVLCLLGLLGMPVSGIKPAGLPSPYKAQSSLEPNEDRSCFYLLDLSLSTDPHPECQGRELTH